MARELLKGTRFDAGCLPGLLDRFAARERERNAQAILTQADWSLVDNARKAFEDGGMAPVEVELRISALIKRRIDKIKGVTNG